MWTSPIDSFFSLHFAVTALISAPLSCLLAFLLLYVITHPRFSKTPLHSKRPLTLTQHNTLLNRNENGGTGVWSRKWRRKVAGALAMAPLRRGLGDPEEELEDELGLDGQDAGYSSSGSEMWTVKVKPVPSGLRGCLKREGSFEVTRGLSSKDASTEEPKIADNSEPPTLSSLSPIPSPATSSASSTTSFYSPPLPLPSPPPPPPEVLPDPIPPLATTPTKRKTKTVSIQEPSLVELEALRELWNSQEMQSSVNGGNGLGGIAGYRRTRDYYARGQGGRGISKVSTTKTPTSVQAPKAPDTAPPRGEVDTKQEKENKAEDEGSSRPRRPVNPSLTRSSSSSLSPAPTTRRPLIKRALSPNSNAVVVGTSAVSRRRGLSPNNAATGVTNPLRSSSSSPAPPSDRTQPRWIKSKKPSPSSKSTNSSMRPAIGRNGREEDEAEVGGTGRNGTMSATVSDEEDGNEDEGDYEDVPPTPPSQPSLALAMAPMTSESPSISPSLELLLNHTSQSLAAANLKNANHREQSDSPTMSGSESFDDSPSPLPQPSLTDSHGSILQSSFRNKASQHLPTPSPTPSPKLGNTPSFSITPASPDLLLSPLPSIPAISKTRSSHSLVSETNEVEAEEDEDEDPNDPISSPTVEAKGIVVSSAFALKNISPGAREEHSS